MSLISVKITYKQQQSNLYYVLVWMILEKILHFLYKLHHIQVIYNLHSSIDILNLIMHDNHQNYKELPERDSF